MPCLRGLLFTGASRTGFLKLLKGLYDREEVKGGDVGRESSDLQLPNPSVENVSVTEVPKGSLLLCLVFQLCHNMFSTLSLKT